MEIDFGIQANCSECALVVYSDKINQKQRSFFEEFFKSKGLETTLTPMGNIAIETEYGTNAQYKNDLWALLEAILEISKFNGLEIKDDYHFALIRDESWYDMLEEKVI